MSCARPEMAPRKEGRPKTSIATRTTLGVVSIVAAVLMVLVVGTYLVSSRTVNAQLDASVRESWQRVASSQGGPPAGPETTRDPLTMPGLVAGTVLAVVNEDGTAVTSGVVDGALSEEDLETLLAAASRTSPGALSRVTLSTGVYVIEVGPLAPGPSGPPPGLQTEPAQTSVDATLVVGLSTADAAGTNQSLLIILIAGALVTLIVVAVGVWAWIARSLRPLRQVAAGAAEVSRLPLEEDAVSVANYQLPASLASGDDEVGAVALALNQLLSSVDGAFEARSLSEQKLRDFLADASHELRTPLAAVRGYAEMLQLTQPLTDEGEAMLGRLLTQSARMNELVEQLLVLARLDAAPKMEDMSRKEVDLGEIVLDAATDMTLTHPDYTWVTNVPGEPVVLSGAPGYLTRMVTNLLSNACKHTPAGTTVSTTLRVVESAADSREAVLEVADNGPGIAPETAAKVFDRFVRGDSARTTTQGSTGLGLSIVQSVADAHGGTVTVSSVPGNTVFTVMLPLD